MCCYPMYEQWPEWLQQLQQSLVCESRRVALAAVHTVFGPEPELATRAQCILSFTEVAPPVHNKHACCGASGTCKRMVQRATGDCRACPCRPSKLSHHSACRLRAPRTAALHAATTAMANASVYTAELLKSRPPFTRLPSFP